MKAEAAEAHADAALLNDLAAVRAARNDPQYNAVLRVWPRVPEARSGR